MDDLRESFYVLCFDTVAQSYIKVLVLPYVSFVLMIVGALSVSHNFRTLPAYPKLWIGWPARTNDCSEDWQWDVLQYDKPHSVSGNTLNCDTACDNMSCRSKISAIFVAAVMVVTVSIEGGFL